MSVHAGQIVTVAGQTVLQRVQSQGLGNVRIPIETVREIGNTLTVDKVPQEPDFTFSMESLDVSTAMEALLQGKVSTGALPSEAAGASDPPGTAYPWETVTALNIISPWKDPQSFGSGNVVAGHIIPGYFPSKLSYKFGITENAMTTAELRGGEFYYFMGAPTEDIFTGTGSQKEFTCAEPGVHFRRGGVEGTTFKSVFGVLVNGVYQVEGQDYTTNDVGPASGNVAAMVTFTNAPADNAQIRVAYFTTNAHAYPDSVHESALVLPGAIRGRNVCLSLASGGGDTWQKVYAVQTVTLDASYDITIERELCNDAITGYTVNGTDCTGTVALHPSDAATFFGLLKQMTGVDTVNEAIGFININPIKIKIEITDPRNPGAVLKTLYVSDAQFDIPGTPARVNAVVDFSMTWNSLSGTYTAYKGAASV